jgi:transposase
MTRPLLAAASLLAPLWLAACAAAPPPAASPEPPPPGLFAGAHEVSPADAEILALGHAEEEIDRLFPHRDAPLGQRKAGPADEAPEKPMEPAPAAAGHDGGYRQAPGSGDPCAVACRALAAMASSADRLCRLAGENDGRCDDARSRVRGATARVGSACPSCAAPSTSPTAPGR